MLLKLSRIRNDHANGLLSITGAADAFHTIRMSPFAICSTANGAPDQPTSTCLLMTIVSVVGALPVTVGVKSTPLNFRSASTDVCAEEPEDE